jgi:hypothetical protein
MILRPGQVFVNETRAGAVKHFVPGVKCQQKEPARSQHSREDELWGLRISMDFFLFQPSEIRRYVEAAGLVIEEIIEREPYSPEVEYQSRRAYLFARKPSSVARQ